MDDLLMDAPMAGEWAASTDVRRDAMQDHWTASQTDASWESKTVEPTAASTDAAMGRWTAVHSAID